MGNITDKIFNQYVLSKKKITLGYNFNCNNYNEATNNIIINSPFIEVKEKYSFEYLNNLFLRKKRIEELPKNNDEKNKLNIFIYDIDIFNISFPKHAIQTLEMICNKYNESNIDEKNKILLFVKPNVKLFDKENIQASQKLQKLILNMNIIDVSRLKI